MKNLTKKYISERDSFILAFLAKFPATSSLAISLLQERQKGVFTEAGGLPTIKSTEQKLRQLSLLGVIQIHKNIYTPDRKNHYGITEYGFEVLKCNPKYSEITSYRTMEKLSVSRLNHYSKISEIASMFISPKDFYRSKLGTGFVELQQLVSENESRKAYSEISQQLQENRKSGAGIKSFSEWRKAELTKAFSEIKNRTLSLNELTKNYPAILTLGNTGENEKRNLFQPDLIIRLDDTLRTSENREAKNLLVEIEISPKTLQEYQEIVKLFSTEIKSKLIYDRVIYFVQSPQVETLLRKADKNQDTELFSSGKLLVLPLPTAEQFSRRVSASPKVQPNFRNGILTKELADF